MAKFINRNNALERSNDAHARLATISHNRRDFVSSDYHFDVVAKQNKCKRILTKKERKHIFEENMKLYGVY